MDLSRKNLVLVKKLKISSLASLIFLTLSNRMCPNNRPALDHYTTRKTENSNLYEFTFRRATEHKIPPKKRRKERGIVRKG